MKPEMVRVNFNYKALAASAALFAILFASLTHALVLNAPSGNPSACPGQTSDLQFLLINDGNEYEVIDTSAINNAWSTSSLTPSFLKLAPGASALLNLAITPSFETIPGKYAARVVAQGRATSTVSRDVDFDVKDCSTVQMQIYGPAQLYACQNTRYMVSIRNDNSQSVIGMLETDLNPAIQQIGEQPFVVLPKSTKNVSLYLDIPCNIKPQKIIFNIQAKNKDNGRIQGQTAALLEALQPPVASGSPAPNATKTTQASGLTGFFTAGTTPLALLIGIIALVAIMFWVSRRVKVDIARKKKEEEQKTSRALKLKVYKGDLPATKLKVKKQ
ncbi:MAG TPA: hypothetical protein VGQ00_03330 [Candidatus Norongarragalinales archaeon]|jgi:hypothetical protein|nr:hypothetical protein [Candidatus Norongarragalinales archaeon]